MSRLLLHPSAVMRAPAREGNRRQSTAIAGVRARAREEAGRWPAESGPFQVPQPSTIARTLVWLMRDRGGRSPEELQGVTRRYLELHARTRANRARSRFEHFDDALQAAIDMGWIVRYESTTGPRYLPNYQRDALPTPSTPAHSEHNPED